MKPSWTLQVPFTAKSAPVLFNVIGELAVPPPDIFTKVKFVWYVTIWELKVKALPEETGFELAIK